MASRQRRVPANRRWRVKAFRFSGELVIEVILGSLHSFQLEISILAEQPDVFHITVDIEDFNEMGVRVYA